MLLWIRSCFHKVSHGSQLTNTAERKWYSLQSLVLFPVCFNLPKVPTKHFDFDDLLVQCTKEHDTTSTHTVQLSTQRQIVYMSIKMGKSSKILPKKSACVVKSGNIPGDAIQRSHTMVSPLIKRKPGNSPSRGQKQRPELTIMCN